LNNHLRPLRLSWKFAATLALLVLLTIVLLSVPIYWQTRFSLETQLDRHLSEKIDLLANRIDSDLLRLFRFVPTLSMRDSIETQFHDLLPAFSALTIFIVDEHGNLILAAGRRDIAVRSVMLHKSDLKQALIRGRSTTSLFSDPAGNHFKSAYLHLTQPEPGLLLGMNADARFLDDILHLRRQIITTGLIAFTASIIIGLVLGNSLTRPLTRLTRLAALIGRGQYAAIPAPHRRDEIGVLAATMNEMQAEIARREKANKQIISSVAHEIQNQLASVLLNTELLAVSTKSDSEIARLAETIRSETRHISEIVDSFLAYARPIEHKLTAAPLSALLESVIDNLKHEFPALRITIAGDEVVWVHPGKMQQAFFNLLKNAAEASPSDAEIRVQIESSGSQIRVTVTNSGAPIPADRWYQIFEAFYTTKENGIGLGLPISRSIVEQHGGQIDLVRSDANGTEFVVILPCEKHVT